MLLLLGLAALAGSVVGMMLVWHCQGGYDESDPCVARTFFDRGLLGIVFVAGAVALFLPIPLAVSAAGSRRRRRLSSAPAQAHLDQAREWLASKRIGPARFESLRRLLNPLARATHPAFGLRAGGGLLAGASFVVLTLGAGLLVFIISWQMAYVSTAYKALIQPLWPAAILLTVVPAVTGLAAFLVSSEAGASLRQARDAATDAMDEAAIEASHGPEAVTAPAKPVLTAPGAVRSTRKAT
jgi:hypothetical protein